jgi:ATP-dependent DNA helicase PIF1
MNLARKQQEFLDAVLEGKNVFLTGKAGTGKSFVLRKAIDTLTQLSKKVIAVAPTGIAASNVGGQTIHSLFSLNPFGVLEYDTCNFLRGEKRRLLDAVEVVIIDEVSMLRPDILDAMNWTLIKNGCKPLLTKQLIFTGDLLQLPPVLDDNTRSVLYQTYDGENFDQAKVYQKLDVIEIELDEVQRQSDPEFIENLNVVREGGKSEYFRQFVNNEAAGVILAPHNSTVQRYNEEGLSKLPGEEFVFKATVTGNVKADDFNLETVVRVKNGAKIMYLLNSKNNPLVNGTLGIFVSYNDCHYIRVGSVDYALDIELCVKREYVFNADQDRLELVEIGSISQYPIKLAYALSIHKSQGLTFDEVTVDLTRPCFQKGQLYVALSRVKSPQGLRIMVNN